MERGGNNNGGIRGNHKTAPDINTAKAKNATTDDTECNVREQDRFMPIANIIRIMRQGLPQHAKISDEAKETVQECVSEFIGFITGEANDRCQREQRRTITAEDLLWAMNKLGFDNYIEPLMLYLERYREIDAGERGSARGEPLVRPVDPGSVGLPGYPPAAFHPMAAHFGYFGLYPVNGFVQDPAAGSAPSQVAMAFAGPSQAAMAFSGPSQAAVARAEPFPPGEE